MSDSVSCGEIQVRMKNGHLGDDGLNCAIGRVGKECGFCVESHLRKISGKERFAVGQGGFMHFDAARFGH